jgi:hypothetical protein
MHARHAWLVGQRESLTTRLEGDPDWFDAKAAGWWLWGIGLWIGSGWCSGDGPWRPVDTEDGRVLARAGDDGQGIHRQLLHAGNDGRGTARIVGWRRDTLLAAFTPLSERLRDVMVVAGDWSRVVTPAVMLGTGTGRKDNALGTCAVYLDPPYPHLEHSGAVYARDHESVAYDVREWALKYGDDPRFRIALSGYEGQWEMPADWTVLAWKTKGGYSSVGGENRNQLRERIWFSPHCLKPGLWG